jgi:hypothetical protein
MTMQLIETKTLGTAAASIEFTSIPQTFTDLVVVASTRKSTTSNTNSSFLRFNSDSATNYRVIRLRGNGSSVESVSNQSRSSITGGQTASSDYTANTFGNSTFYISNYTTSTAKSVSIDSVTENNATESYQEIIAGSYVGAGVITSISLEPDSGNFVTGSTISLYGITKGSDGIVTTS